MILSFNYSAIYNKAEPSEESPAMNALI